MKTTIVTSNSKIVSISFEIENDKEALIKLVIDKMKQLVKDELVQKAPMSGTNTNKKSYTATGMLTAKPITDEQAEAIEDERTSTPIIMKEEEVDDLIDKAEEQFFTENGVTENEAMAIAESHSEVIKEKLIEKAPAPLKKMIKEKVVVATMKKADKAVKAKAKPKAKKVAPPSDLETQPKDVIEQMKKNNGQSYLNRRGKVVQPVGEVAPPISAKDLAKEKVAEMEALNPEIDNSVQVPPPPVIEVVGDKTVEVPVIPNELEEIEFIEPTAPNPLRVRFDEVILRAHELGFTQKSIDAIKWEQNNTEVRIEGLERVIQQQEDKANK